MDPWPRTYLHSNLGYASLSSNTHSFYAHHPTEGIIRNGDYIRSDHIEAERRQIRRQSIAMELASRHALEAQVRRERLMEEEVKLRRPESLQLPFPLSSSSSNQNCCGGYDWDRLDRTIPSQSLHDYGAFDRFLYKRSSEAASVNVVEPTFQRLPNFDAKSPVQSPLEARASDVARTLSGKLFVLPKGYHLDLSGAKRKETEVAMAESIMPPSVENKKRKSQSHKEWRCFLCRVSATSEQGLRDHLRGKKHKAARKAKRVKGKQIKPRKFKGKEKKILRN